ncbi:MAG: type I DNA topoisomerase [Elusimicrobia bacterium]|nr:type I DNA topoisomerase [Elusimicrobiota bacterium]
MAKSLLIVESPTKERTIGPMLGKDYVVRSSYGHIRDLPKKGLGVDVENGFKPSYVVMPRAKKNLDELVKLAGAADRVYLATDLDREGESIAWHLSKVLKLTKGKTKRITFHEITKAAIQEALQHPRDIDEHLVDAQVARRVLDRLVGYRLSPLLWEKIRPGLSAGRVQSVAVRLICAREEEIEKFKAEEYWTLTALLEKEGQAFTAGLYAQGATKFNKFSFRQKGAVDAVLADLKGASYAVASVEPKERRRSPAAPFTTASLQQDSSRRLHYSVSRTMVIAQQLYEGVEVAPGEGPVGLITYMRTDSVQVARVAQSEAAEFIKKTYGQDHLPAKPRTYKTKSKSAQEAHEAIRPSQPSRTPESVRAFLDPDQFKLYELIWRRFMASQMADAIYDTVTADISAQKYLFRAAGHTLKFPGYLAVYGEVADEDAKKDGDESSTALPPLSAGDPLDLKELRPEQHFTEPPPRYNEASLVKTMEEHGIGRPSTYAPIMHTIVDRGYVRLEERRFFPSSLGRVVDGQLLVHFPEIVNVDFTAKMEDSLDEIAAARAEGEEVLKNFYGPFEAEIQKAGTAMEKIEIKPEASDEKCPKCQAPMGIRENRNGRYLACSRYPDCKSTIPIDRSGKKIVPEQSKEVCPNCGLAMVVRVGRGFGRRPTRYIACTGYPACKTTFSIDKDGNKIVRPKPEPTEEKCGKCGRMMWKRVGKRGPFLACSGFPKCRNIKPFPPVSGENPKTPPPAGKPKTPPAAEKPAPRSSVKKPRKGSKKISPSTGKS